MNDIIILIWIPEGLIYGQTTQIYKQSFAVDYLVNDCSYYINGFDSMASDPVPEEIKHLMLDTNIPNQQIDNRILYYTPTSTKHTNSLLSLNSNFKNDIHSSGESQAALQVFSETFSGYMIPLTRSTITIDSKGTTKLKLAGFQLYRWDGTQYVQRTAFTFSAQAVWDIRYGGVLRLVNTQNAQDTFAVSLVSHDKLSGTLLNKVYNEPQVSTIRTFEDHVKSVLSITNEGQVQNGHITGMNNLEVASTTLTYLNHTTLLARYNYRELKH